MQSDLTEERATRTEASLFDDAPVAYLVTTLDGVIRRANRPAARLLGLSRPGLQGRRLRELTDLASRSDLDAAVDRALASGTVTRVSVALHAGEVDDGSEAGAVLMPVQAVILAEHGDNGAGPTELRIVLIDTTRADANDALAAPDGVHASEELAHARQLIRWQATMLASTFHDLRTPLTVMKSTNETLLVHGDEFDHERVSRLLLKGQEHAARLERIIDSLARFSREQLGARSTTRGTHRIDEMVRQVAKVLDLEGHRLQEDFGHLWMQVDTDQAERLLENLLRNAIAHTPPGTTITVSSRRLGGRDLLVVVADDGPGIADETKERIFLPFHSTANDRGGTGLGLSIVGMFAAMHGGRVWVDDADGGGAAFHVLLPGAAIDGPLPT